MSGEAIQDLPMRPRESVAPSRRVRPRPLPMKVSSQREPRGRKDLYVVPCHVALRRGTARALSLIPAKRWLGSLG